MNTSEEIAKRFKEVYLGGNWTASNLKSHLEDVTLREATTKLYDLNTIASLTYHLHYYVLGVTEVLEGKPLTIKDQFSFEHPPLNSEDDWRDLKKNLWIEAEVFSGLIANIPERKWSEFFTEEKYGNYFRNINGIIEHCHYHLGQIVVIKKILRQAG